MVRCRNAIASRLLQYAGQAMNQVSCVSDVQSSTALMLCRGLRACNAALCVDTAATFPFDRSGPQ